MSTRIEAWETIRPVRRTTRLNKTITIPAFNIQCGELKNCLYFSSASTGGVSVDPANNTSYRTAFTLQAWVKVNQLDDNDRVIVGHIDVNTTFLAVLSLYGNSVRCSVKKTTVQTVTSTLKVPQGEWAHVAAIYDGTTVTLYINGVLDATTLAIAASLDNHTTTHLLYIGSGAGSSNVFLGYMDEVIVRNTAITQDTLLQQYQRPRNKDYTSSIDSEIIAYYNFNNPLIAGGTTTFANKKSASGTMIITQSLAITLITDQGAPISLGGSFIPIQFSVNAGVKSALQFPVSEPTDCNFGLLVSWTDSNGDFQRRLLFAPDGVDIGPMPEEYNGETLSENYVLEIWNIDGEPYVTLEDDLILNTSLTSMPTQSSDHTQLNTDLVGDSSLFEVFPFVFPITFNGNQTYN